MESEIKPQIKPSRHQDLVCLESPHERAGNKQKLIELNINGLKYQMLESVYLKLPILDRIKASVVEVFNHKTHTTEYFLDTDAPSFFAIVEYYKNRGLHLPANVCPNVFKKEMEFWGIDFQLLKPCCFIKLSSFNTGRVNMLELNPSF